MSSKIVQAADAVVALIGTTQAGYTAVREWTLNRTEEDFLKTGWITVVPVTRAWPERRSRVGVERTFDLSIGVQKLIVGAQGVIAPKDQVDAVDAVAEAIGELLMLPSSKIVGATCQTVEGPVVMSHEHLTQLRLATSVMAVRYKVDP